VPGEVAKFGVNQGEFYLENANVPDLIIDVDARRAKIRSDRFGLTKPVCVIPNTLPLDAIPDPAPSGTLSKISGCTLPKDKRILLFTGLASTTTLNALQAVLSAVVDRMFLLWFAHGTKKAVAKAQYTLQSRFGEDRVHVCKAVTRSVLLSAQHEADAGLIAYSYRSVPTMNQKHAAPTKLYEYLASGLPIVSYPNPTILDLVERYKLGVCSKEDAPESLAHAIVELFRRDDFSLLREHVRSVFTKELVYEKYSTSVLDNMCKMILEYRE